jgi:hypothetical protein
LFTDLTKGLGDFERMVQDTCDGVEDGLFLGTPSQLVKNLRQRGRVKPNLIGGMGERSRGIHQFNYTAIWVALPSGTREGKLRRVGCGWAASPPATNLSSFLFFPPRGEGRGQEDEKGCLVWAKDFSPIQRLREIQVEVLSLRPTMRDAHQHLNHNKKNIGAT